MAAHNYQIFEGVANAATYLGNIKNVASANGWTVDKDAIASGGELYIHSTGNGNQSLYFSFKIRTAIDDDSKKYLVWHCNTGFNTSAAWDAQPGRFSVIPKTGYLVDGARWYYAYSTTMGYNCADFAHWIAEPAAKQFVFACSQSIVVVQRVVHSMMNGTTFAGYSAFVIGAMDSVSGASEGELNFTLASPWGHGGGIGSMFNPWMILPNRDIYSHRYRCTIQPFGLLYGGSNAISLPAEDYEGYSGGCPKVFRTSIGRLTAFGASRSFYWNNSCAPRWEAQAIGNGYDTYMAHCPQNGVDYSQVLLHNPGMARTVLHQPIISVEDMSGDTHYCYPTRACLPYYALAMSPYVKPEQVVSLGSRSFMSFPALSDNDDFGYAIEINV
jgi:hypothetical protein